MIKLIMTQKSDYRLNEDMKKHYSRPKGFVGRSIIYKIYYNDIYFGSIAGGSATKFLPGRNEYFSKIYNDKWWLESIVNNIFFHIEPKYWGTYPIRNFSEIVLNKFKEQISEDWSDKYGNYVLGFESLVELPRTGNIYKRNKWELVGQTKGYTCKRIGGLGTDSWSGKRVWNTTELRPKLVFCTFNG